MPWVMMFTQVMMQVGVLMVVLFGGNTPLLMLLMIIYSQSPNNLMLASMILMTRWNLWLECLPLTSLHVH